MKLLFTFLVTLNTAFAQDLIYLKNNNIPVNAKVIEVNIVEVKYKFPSDSFPIMSFLRIEVQKIELSNGEIVDIAKKEDLHVNYRVGSIKTGFISPIYDHVNIGYEGYIRERQSWEVTIGKIGIGRPINEGESAKGGYLKLGYKWIVSPNNYFQYNNPTKLLSGFYVRPEISYGKFTISYPDRKVYTLVSTSPSYRYTMSMEPVDSKEVTFISTIINLGYQFVLKGGFTIDTSIGGGYFGASFGKYKNGSETNFYIFRNPEYKTPLAICGQVKIGYSFCKEKRFLLAQ